MKSLKVVVTGIFAAAALALGHERRRPDVPRLLRPPRPPRALTRATMTGPPQGQRCEGPSTTPT